MLNESHREILDNADELFDAETIQRAIDKVADRLNAYLSDTEVVALCVLNGGLIYAGQLLTRLTFEVKFDYCHATRYRNTTSGSTIAWLAQPHNELDGKTVLIIDDILDEGVTLEAIIAHCEDAGAARIITTVLLEKRHSRRVSELQADHVALEVEDRYVFGFGMDYEGSLRNLDSIYAVKE